MQLRASMKIAEREEEEGRFGRRRQTEKYWGTHVCSDAKKMEAQLGGSILIQRGLEVLSLRSNYFHSDVPVVPSYSILSVTKDQLFCKYVASSFAFATAPHSRYFSSA